MPLTPRSEPTDERSRQRRLRGSASGRRASGRSVFGRRAFGRRGLGLVGVAALLVTAVGAPSIAATGTLTYSCTTAIGNKDMATTYDTDVPSVMHVGDPAVTIKVTENVTTDASLIGQAYTFLGARTSEASTSPSISLNGTATTVNMVAPLTPINSGQPLVSSYVGTWGTFTPTTPGTYDLDDHTLDPAQVRRLGRQCRRLDLHDRSFDRSDDRHLHGARENRDRDRNDHLADAAIGTDLSQ
jgi:hypothetical protein